MTALYKAIQSLLKPATFSILLTRTFHSTQIKLEEAKETEAPAAFSYDDVVIDRETLLHEWLKKKGWKYRKIIPYKPNFIYKKSQPFPLNPQFYVQPPLTDYTREEIFREYKQNPNPLTIREISKKYAISMKRVEAVLRLKYHEKYLVEKEGFVLQRKYNKAMQRLLCHGKRIYEQPNTIDYQVENPRFHPIEENQELSSEDAASLLGRKPFSPDQLPTFDDFSFTKEEAKEKRVVLSKDTVLSNSRWNFMFTDTNSELPINKRTILVRETDGTLRKATPSERKKQIRKLWKEDILE